MRLVCIGWEEVAGGRLWLLEGRVGGRGHDGAVAGRAWRRGRRELRHVEGGLDPACKTRSGLFLHTNHFCKGL